MFRGYVISVLVIFTEHDGTNFYTANATLLIQIAHQCLTGKLMNRYMLIEFF